MYKIIVQCTYIIKYFSYLISRPRMDMGGTKSPKKSVLENNKKRLYFWGKRQNKDSRPRMWAQVAQENNRLGG